MEQSESVERLHDPSPYSTKSLAEGKALTFFGALNIQAVPSRPGPHGEETAQYQSRPTFYSCLFAHLTQSSVGLFLPLLPTWTSDQAIVAVL